MWYLWQSSLILRASRYVYSSKIIFITKIISFLRLQYPLVIHEVPRCFLLHVVSFEFTNLMETVPWLVTEKITNGFSSKMWCFFFQFSQTIFRSVHKIKGRIPFILSLAIHLRGVKTIARYSSPYFKTDESNIQYSERDDQSLGISN